MGRGVVMRRARESEGRVRGGVREGEGEGRGEDSEGVCKRGRGGRGGRCVSQRRRLDCRLSVTDRWLLQGSP